MSKTNRKESNCYTDWRLYIAIHLKELAERMEYVAYEMRATSKNKEVRQHARELRGAAKIAKGWARAVKSVPDDEALQQNRERPAHL